MDYEDAFLAPDPSPYAPDATFGSTPPAPPQPPPPQQCPHCRRRLEAMRGEFPGVAQRWEAAWLLSQLPCFGVCQCAEFCVTHSLPLHYCTVNSPGDPGHETLVFRSKWERSGRGLLPTACVPPGGCDECARRLSVMLRADWVRRDPDISDTLQLKCTQAMQGGPCTGVCKSHHFCKLHLCAAVRDRASEAVIPGMLRRKATQFSCPLPHDRVANGRHHEQFAFFCDAPCCAPGRWFSREATHRKPLQRHQQRHQQQQQQALVAPKHEDAQRPRPPSGGGAAPAVASTSNEEAGDDDEEEGNRGYAVACGRRARRVAAERRAYAAAMALEALLLCAAAAAVVALSAARTCGPAAPRARAGRQVAIDDAALSSSAPAERCAALPRQLCYARDAGAAAFACDNCTHGRGNASGVWDCYAYTADRHTMHLRVDPAGDYALEWSHQPWSCTVAQIAGACPTYVVRGSAADSGGVVVLDSPLPPMLGWLFVFH
eukprot:m51a1_g266 hypothetical protein (488) ;mRNA; r:238231-240310